MGPKLAPTTQPKVFHTIMNGEKKTKKQRENGIKRLLCVDWLLIIHPEYHRGNRTVRKCCGVVVAVLVEHNNCIYNHYSGQSPP